VNQTSKIKFRELQNNLERLGDRVSAYEVGEECADSGHVPLVNLRTSKTTHDSGQGAEYP
jgi:hypothetical protein